MTTSPLLRKKRFFAGIGLVTIVACSLTAFLVLRSSSDAKCNACSKKNISPLGEVCSDSPLGTYKNYAISTDSNVCAVAGE